MASIQSISGFPEWTPQEKVVEEDFLAKIRRVFQLNGFSPIETPAVERVSTLVAKGGNEKEIYKIGRLHSSEESSDDGDLALHFDLTVPMARYVAQHERELAFPFRRYQIQQVWRGERAQSGRFRQFYQCDIDIVGRESLPLVCDAEIAGIMASVLRSLNIGNFEIRINNRKILQGFLSGVGISVSHHLNVMRCIDKLEKIGREEVLKEIRETLGNPDFDASPVLDFLSQQIPLERLEELRTLSTDAVYQQGVAELIEVASAAVRKGVGPKELVVDLTIARGLDYYTGTVFETRLVEYPGIGSVCSGGRFEDLVGTFAKGKYPGVGMSIGLTRLLWQLFKGQVIVPRAQSYAKFLLVPLSPAEESVVGYTESFAARLRAKDVPCEVSPIQGKLTKHIEYAEKKGIPHVILVGDTEVANKTVRVKNLATRQQFDPSFMDIEFFSTF
jgi:histidyl-tRNA synthetase